MLHTTEQIGMGIELELINSQLEYQLDSRSI